MALLERVSTLIRANLNDLIDKAEDPEKMIKQVILDMQNQLMQVKTQVAITIADQHVLDKKQRENTDKEAEWMRKAELAVDKKQDDLARAALERSMSYKQMAGNFDAQVADQKTEVENLKAALHKLESKLAEAESKSGMLIAQHRRSRAAKTSDAQVAIGDKSKVATFERMKTGRASRERSAKPRPRWSATTSSGRLGKQDGSETAEEIKARRAEGAREEGLISTRRPTSIARTRASSRASTRGSSW
jgi:phage shock protein A